MRKKCVYFYSAGKEIKRVTSLLLLWLQKITSSSTIKPSHPIRANGLSFTQSPVLIHIDSLLAVCCEKEHELIVSRCFTSLHYWAAWWRTVKCKMMSFSKIFNPPQAETDLAQQQSAIKALFANVRPSGTELMDHETREKIRNFSLWLSQTNFNSSYW